MDGTKEKKTPTQVREEGDLTYPLGSHLLRCFNTTRCLLLSIFKVLVPLPVCVGS